MNKVIIFCKEKREGIEGVLIAENMVLTTFKVSTLFFLKCNIK